MEISKAVQTDAAKSVIIHPVEGFGDVSFPKKTTREVAAYGDKIKTRRHESIKASAKAAGLSPEQAYRALRESEYEVSLEEIADYLNTPKMAIELVEESLKAAGRNGDIDSIIESLGIHGSRDLARKIAGTSGLFRKPVAETSQQTAKPDDQSGFGAPPLP